ncbi:fatty acid desaturase [Pontibaca methylaminivorans]|uniref:Omega-6 fatty acid desaturase (Delta-12 desaturase) n=1 Tax=Pontibaca methylaminivorans TaxID=515897 RepID=A0A1R3WAB0_9RHOB|nr:fatty acid desaturase [Pontibaca methylaminivorans]SIT74933.1 omega-6 fatty acid desaturase (delta-12 desaturase) [Pontibaca methylaminivorans]
MKQVPKPPPSASQDAAAGWTRRLVTYRTPILTRSCFELAVTAWPFAALFALSWAALSLSPWLSVLLSLANAAFVVRLFMIQHDCGHGSFFPSRKWNDRVGRIIGVLTLTPYAVWRRTHAIHHATTGNLDRRGTGDIPTLTVAEYRAKPPLQRGLYRLLRNPAILFGMIPFYIFFLQNRLPVGLMRSGWRPWVSALGTNAAIAAMLTSLYLLGGVSVLLFVYLPMMLLAASAGMWLFYVQHQFEETSWNRNAEWSVQDAAFHGSSHYDLPPVLRWITANIGVHHIHHLASRIPFYRLPEVLRDHKSAADAARVTFRESLRCARLALWDERNRRLVSFAAARRLAPQSGLQQT